jgi:hypothetical protein
MVFPCYKLNGTNNIIHTNCENAEIAISELKKTIESLSKISESLFKADAQETSTKIIQIAKDNFSTLKKLRTHEYNKLKKSWNPISMIILRLAESFHFYLGNLGSIHNIYDKFNKIIQSTKRKKELNELINEINSKGKEFYLETEPKGIKNIINDLKKLSKYLFKNESILVILPLDEQHLKYIKVSRGVQDGVQIEEQQIKCLGKNGEGKFEFYIENEIYPLTITGVEELKNYINPENKVIFTRDEALKNYQRQHLRDWVKKELNSRKNYT